MTAIILAIVEAALALMTTLLKQRGVPEADIGDVLIAVRGLVKERTEELRAATPIDLEAIEHRAMRELGIEPITEPPPPAPPAPPTLRP